MERKRITSQESYRDRERKEMEEMENRQTGRCQSEASKRRKGAVRYVRPREEAEDLARSEEEKPRRTTMKNGLRQKRERKRERE